MSKNNSSAAESLYPMFLISPTPIPKALQRRILEWAATLVTDEYLLVMARRTDLEPDVEAALSKMSAKVLAAWLTVPGRVSKYTTRFLKEKRISVLSVIATTEGLPKELYEHCANRGNATVASHLVLNRDATDAQKATAMTTLIQHREESKLSYNARLQLQAKLATALQRTPTLAEVVAKAATKAETVAMVLKVAGVHITGPIVDKFVKTACSQLVDAYIASERSTKNEWNRYRQVMFMRRVIADVVDRQILPAESLETLKRAVTSTITRLTSYANPGRDVANAVGNLTELTRRIDRFIPKLPIGGLLYQLAGAKDQDTWRKQLGAVDRVITSGSPWIVPTRLAMAEATLLSPAVTASGIAWAIRTGLISNSHVGSRRLRHVIREQFYQGNREGGMATYVISMTPGTKPSSEMKAIWEHHGVSMTEVRDLAVRLYMEAGEATTAVAWGQYGDGLNAALVAEVDVADLYSIAQKGSAREVLLAYIVEKIDDGDDVAWERFAMLAERPFHGSIGDLIASTCRLAQLEST